MQKKSVSSELIQSLGTCVLLIFGYAFVNLSPVMSCYTLKYQHCYQVNQSWALMFNI